MPELIEAYWPYLLIALAIGIAVGWFIFVANRKTSVTGERRDVLDEGADRAQRNQALIDAPPAAANLSNPANTQEVAHATATTDAEAGAPVMPSVPAEKPVVHTEPQSGGDDLTRIKGLGPKLAAMLNGLGISSYSQIANWSEEEVDRIDSELGRFQGRIRRDSWVEQAKLLAAGDETGFSAKFGQNG